MKRSTVWAAATALGLVAGAVAGMARASFQGPGPDLVVTSPKDGARVREKVNIVVPATAVPRDGFIAVYVDGQFKAALAPPPPDENVTPGKPRAPKPIAYVWDTKAPSTDALLNAQQAVAQDGPHILDIRSYNNSGTQLAEKRLTVTLSNKIATSPDQVVRLAYHGRVGWSWYDQQHIDFLAQAGVAGFAQTTSNPYTKLTHKEADRYLLSVEDFNPGLNEQYIRERREPLIYVDTNGTPQTVRLQSSSVYYTMSGTGRVQPSGVMKRTKREPFANIMELPGRTMRMGESFNSFSR